MIAADAFRSAMLDKLGAAPREIIGDGKIHRFATGKKLGDAGWYVLYEDGVPSGQFGDWRTGLSSKWRADLPQRNLTPKERAAHRDRIREMRRQRAIEEAKRHKEAREEATRIWEEAPSAPADHPYLVKKAVKPHGLRIHESKLVAPLQDSDGVLHSLQYITAQGRKLFLFGRQVTGCYALIGEPNGLVCVAEGYATAATIFETTGIAVAVAFNCGNLSPVAHAIQAKFGGDLIICADDDIATPGNPGLRDARKAAQQVNALLAIPDFSDDRSADGATDFNDLARLHGAEAVRDSINRAKPVESHQESDKTRANGADHRAESSKTPDDSDAYIPPEGEPERPKGNGRSAEPYFQTAADFCREFTPPAYAIDGLLRSTSLYALTARTGAGKTSFLVAAALAVVTGRKDILGRDVEQGRVVFFCGENPEDFRMRLMVAAWTFNIDLDALGDLLIIRKRRDKPEQMVAELAAIAKDHPVTLAIVDTFAAYFDGPEVNSPTLTGEFMRRLRPLGQVNGKPSILVACHPIKNASESQLIPYGAGAIVNEVDGNLTLWIEGDITTLHWQEKIRGTDFAPIRFRIEPLCAPTVVDIHNKQIPMPILRPSDEDAVESAKKATSDTKLALLRAMMANPSGSIRDWAGETNRSPSTISGALKKLAAGKLVDQLDDKWIITKKGQTYLKAAEQAAEEQDRTEQKTEAKS